MCLCSTAHFVIVIIVGLCICVKEKKGRLVIAHINIMF